MKILVHSFFLVCVMTLQQVAWPATISKCQDADGHWHYGDFAAEACAKSKVTTMNAQGLQIGEDAAPLTPEELEARDKLMVEQSAARRLAEEMDAKRKRIVAIYDSEADILRARDTHLASVDQRKTTEESILAGLKARAGRVDEQISQLADGDVDLPALVERRKSLSTQVRRFEAALSKSIKEREKITSDYEEEVAVYRDLTGTTRE